MKMRAVWPGRAWPVALVALGGLAACDRERAQPRPVADAMPVHAEPAAPPNPPSPLSGSGVGSTPYGAAAPMAPGTDLGRPLTGQVDPAPMASVAPDAVVAGAPPGAGVPAGGQASPASALTATELAFVTQAIEAGLFDIRVGQLGVDRAGNSVVRSYAALLVSDQTAMNRQLQQLARQLGVPVPTTLSEPRQRIVDELARTADGEFDRQFVLVAGTRVQQDTVALFERTGRETRDAQVRSFVLAALPTLRAHLSAAERLPVRG